MYLEISPTDTGIGTQCSAQHSGGVKCPGFGRQDPTWTLGPNSSCLAQEVLEEWLNCQRAWLYLEPIFSSEDINRQLPVESKRYQTMERIWRKIMKNAYENREASSHRDGLGQLGPLRVLVTLLGDTWSHFSLNKKDWRTSPRLWSWSATPEWAPQSCFSETQPVDDSPLRNMQSTLAL